MTATHVSPAVAQELIDSCRVHAIGLPRRNLPSGGIFAATPGAGAEARGYTAIFARNAAVCGLGWRCRATLWWLIVIAYLDRTNASPYCSKTRRAIGPTSCRARASSLECFVSDRATRRGLFDPGSAAK